MKNKRFKMKEYLLIVNMEHASFLFSGSITCHLCKTTTIAIYSPNPLTQTMFKCLSLLTEVQYFLHSCVNYHDPSVTFSYSCSVPFFWCGFFFFCVCVCVCVLLLVVCMYTVCMYVSVCKQTNKKRSSTLCFVLVCT